MRFGAGRRGRHVRGSRGPKRASASYHDIATRPRGCELGSHLHRLQSGAMATSSPARLRHRRLRDRCDDGRRVPAAALSGRLVDLVAQVDPDRDQALRALLWTAGAMVGLGVLMTGLRHLAFIGIVRLTLRMMSDVAARRLLAGAALLDRLARQQLRRLDRAQDHARHVGARPAERHAADGAAAVARGAGRLDRCCSACTGPRWASSSRLGALVYIGADRRSLSLRLRRAGRAARQRLGHPARRRAGRRGQLQRRGQGLRRRGARGCAARRACSTSGAAARGAPGSRHDQRHARRCAGAARAARRGHRHRAAALVARARDAPATSPTCSPPSSCCRAICATSACTSATCSAR